MYRNELFNRFMYYLVYSVIPCTPAQEMQMEIIS